MDVEATQASNKETRLTQEDNPRRRRKKAINSVSRNSMDQISVEFVLPTVARGGRGPDTLQLDVALNWTVEQVTNLEVRRLVENLLHVITLPFLLVARSKLRCG